MGDGSLQSWFGVNLHLKRAKNRFNVAKCGEADRVALTGGAKYMNTTGNSGHNSKWQEKLVQDTNDET
jgi:hypothetical protein